MKKMKKEVLLYVSIFSLAMLLNFNVNQKKSADSSIAVVITSAMANSENIICNSDIVCSNGLDGKPRNSSMDDLTAYDRCCKESSDDRGVWD